LFEFETLLAFGVGAGLVGLAPLVRRLGGEQLSDSMSASGKSLAKRGIKMGVVVAGVATSAAQTVARGAAEAAESFNDLVAEAKAELRDSGEDQPSSVGESEATEGASTEVCLD